MSIIAWKTINWTQVEFRVRRYQTRIYKASRDNNSPKVRCLQKRLLRSLDAKLMAVRRVTTLNKGKRTPGIDKKIFVTDNQKGKLVQKLRLDGKAPPIKRMYIEKPGKFCNPFEKSNWETLSQAKFGCSVNQECGQFFRVGETAGFFYCKGDAIHPKHPRIVDHPDYTLYIGIFI